MNSALMNGSRSSEAAKISVAISIVAFGWSRAQSRGLAYFSFIQFIGRFCFSLTPFLNQYEASTGTSVKVRISAPTRANDMVSAIGWNSFPAGPVNA